jgi:hypothetical protein
MHPDPLRRGSPDGLLQGGSTGSRQPDRFLGPIRRLGVVRHLDDLDLVTVTRSGAAPAAPADEHGNLEPEREVCRAARRERRPAEERDEDALHLRVLIDQDPQELALLEAADHGPGGARILAPEGLDPPLTAGEPDERRERGVVPRARDGRGRQFSRHALGHQLPVPDVPGHVQDPAAAGGGGP